MNPAHLNYRNALIQEIFSNNKTCTFNLKFSARNERKILKTFLLVRLHRLFCELFSSKIPCNLNNSLVECYAMDSKIIQLLIQGIVETGEYTLEGIAYHTHIPFDVIYDAACGISNQLSITPWARIVDLYLQVKPDIARILIDKLLEIREKNGTTVSLLLSP